MIKKNIYKSSTPRASLCYKGFFKTPLVFNDWLCENRIQRTVRFNLLDYNVQTLNLTRRPEAKAC